eukprot:403362449
MHHKHDQYNQHQQLPTSQSNQHPPRQHQQQQYHQQQHQQLQQNQLQQAQNFQHQLQQQQPIYNSYEHKMIHQTDQQLQDLLVNLSDMRKSLKNFKSSKQNVLHQSALSFHSNLKNLKAFVDANEQTLTSIPLTFGLQVQQPDQNPLKSGQVANTKDLLQERADYLTYMNQLTRGKSQALKQFNQQMTQIFQNQPDLLVEERLPALDDLQVEIGGDLDLGLSMAMGMGSLENGMTSNGLRYNLQNDNQLGGNGLMRNAPGVGNTVALEVPDDLGVGMGGMSGLGDDMDLGDMGDLGGDLDDLNFNINPDDAENNQNM